MKKIILAAAAAMMLPFGAQAGEITAGSVPGSINYQGRLERDNAPITGTIHMYFRIYNIATGTGAGACGGVNQPCLWQSPEITAEATQGVFSATLAFNPAELLYIFSGTQQRYLEVQVESDVLTPREPLSSVAYALVAKKLEDGASVTLSTVTVGYQVLLATNSYAKVGIGTNSPTQKLTINGSIELQTLGNGITFPNGTIMTTAGVGSAVASVTSDDYVTIRAANVSAADIIFNTPAIEIARMTYAGDMGIGTPTPSGKLDVVGSLYIGNEGLYDRDDGEVNVKEDLVVEGGKVRGTGDNYISLGETPDTIIAATGNTQRLWLTSAGNLGVGVTAPASERIYASGNMRATTGVRGGSVSIGAYNNTWTGSANEVRAIDGSPLLLQQGTPYYVGIGTDTPREKLHVRGSILSDYGVRAATAAFTSDVSVNGNFTANGNNKNVYLSTTTIYGDLIVNGRISLPNTGFPAYLASTQTFTGMNTFENQVEVSSDVFTINRLGAGVTAFNFPGSKYLQVGDGVLATDNAMAYLVSGLSSNSKLNFYRGPTEAARLETQGDKTLALVVNGQTKTYTDATYHRIQNSVVWISTGYASTPAIYVSSYMGNVGMGTPVLDPNWKLTVEGNLRISTISSPGQSYGIIFADGTMMTTAKAIGSATSISNNSDAVIQSDADQSGSGNVLLRAGSLDGLILNSGGNVGIGTVNPVAKLNVRGGDLVLGTPVNTYSFNNVEDLVVGGSIIFDGALVQRSPSAVELSNLIVANSVYLSTVAAARTGIGNPAPAYKLDVTGDINATGALRTGGTARISATGNIGSGNADATWDGDTISATRGGTGLNAVAAGNILYTSGANTFAPTAISAYGRTLIDDADAATARGTLLLGTIATQDSNNVAITGGSIAGITDLAIADGGTAHSAWTQYGLLYAPTTGSLGQLGLGTNVQVLHGNAAGAAAWGAVSLTADVADVLPVANGGTGANSLTGVLIGNAAGAFTAKTGSLNTLVKWGTAGATITNSLLSDDGTDISANSHKIVSLATPAGDYDAATKKYVDDQTGGVSGPVWSKYGNTVYSGNFMGSTNYEDVVFKSNNSTRMTITKDGALQLNSALGVTYGGTGANLSATGGATSFVRQAGVGAAFTVGTIGTGDLPTVPVSKGGTGTGTTLDGVLLGGNPITALTGTGSQYLRRNAGNTAYEFGGIDTGHITSGTLGFGRGGTNTTTIASGLVRSNGSALSGGASVALGSEVSGTLPVTSGGTGVGTLTGVVHGSGTGNLTAGNVDLTSEVTGTLPVNKGGTGIAAAGASGKVVCWKATGVLGVCSDAPGAGGTCTCN